MLADQFDSAVFFAADLLKAAEAQGGAPKAGTASPDATGIYEEYLKRQRKDFSTNIHIRVLEDLLNQPKEPLFFGWVKGKKYPPALIAVDPLGAEELRMIGTMLGGEQTAFMVYDRQKGGSWYLSHLRDEVEKGQATVAPPLVHAEHYGIDTTILGRGEISGTTIMTFVVNAPALRVLPIGVTGKLRLQEVSYSPAGATPAWTTVPFIQEKEDEDSEAAVVFPATLKAGERYDLKSVYKGKDVLFDAGDGNYSVGARQSWYPNVGAFNELAMFDLTFHTPQKLQIVATGNEAEGRVEGNNRLSVWKSSMPLRVAGFNIGRFKKLAQDDKDSGMGVDVYTNTGTPDVINEINRILEARSGRYDGGDIENEMGGPTMGGPSSVKIDTGKLAQSAMADGVNTARTGNYFFGPLPQKRVAITQQSQWSFGQSWPSLIYLPYLAFLDGTTRNTLGLNDMKDIVDTVGPHEFGHQWWGHQVGWRSYHDQWLSEGFAEFTAGLVVQQTAGWAKYNAFWEKKRRTILEKPRGAIITSDVVGPISQGWRLSTWQNYSAYDVIVYEKGAYVLHMLRMTMQDRSKQNPDEPFIAMMKDFVSTWSGKNPSTHDFQQIVEKHATPTLKLTANGKLDWFFRQWVYGTAIPKYAANISFQDVGGGKYKVTGTVTQSQVPDDFAVVMPVYVNFDNGAYARFATIVLVGNTTKPIDFEGPLPRKPKSFSINNLHDVLAR